MSKNEPTVDFDDLLWTVDAIAKEIRRTKRQAQYLIDQGVIEVLRVGPKTIVASRSKIRERFAALTSEANTA